jgi:hypothetical protein
MPLMRASALEIPEGIPAGATAQADQQGAFNEALSRLLAAIDEHNGSVASPAGRNPAIQYDQGASAY